LQLCVDLSTVAYNVNYNLIYISPI